MRWEAMKQCTGVAFLRCADACLCLELRPSLWGRMSGIRGTDKVWVVLVDPCSFKLAACGPTCMQLRALDPPGELFACWLPALMNLWA